MVANPRLPSMVEQCLAAAMKGCQVGGILRRRWEDSFDGRIRSILSDESVSAAYIAQRLRDCGWLENRSAGYVSVCLHKMAGRGLVIKELRFDSLALWRRKL